jgi:GNAT superfamily N-acetyltransferase
MILRKMEWTDIPAALSLCRSAGWNQLSRDWEIFLTLNPQGNTVCVNDRGNVVGSVATIRYGADLAWVGMVLVDPAHRQKGIGYELLQKAGQTLKDENCVKLDATPAGRQVYTKLGFKDEYELSRLSAQSFNDQHLVSYPATSALAAGDLENVRLLDRDIFGADRITLLSWMLDGAPEFAFKVGEGEQLKGYCLGRFGYRYAHIGPVVANDVEVAKGLVSAALKHCGDKPVILDVPDHWEAWRRWLELVGFSALRPFIRMYQGNNLSTRISENQYAILGPEFG